MSSSTPNRNAPFSGRRLAFERSDERPARPVGNKPGDRVPRSGIYRMEHDRLHTMAHEVTCIANEVFPACRDCGDGVSYQIVRPALHIKEHPGLRK
jgi:hypothetical protein